MKSVIEDKQSRLILQLVASILAVGVTGNTANAQSTNAPAASANSGSATNVTKLENVTVIGKLDQARNQIVPDLGATVYTVSREQISSLAQGENAPFNEVLLRAPGMAQDSAANGDLHLRGEHANIQYRINDVLLPEGISGFGQELSTRFVDSLRVITGSLPAQYGFRTAGIVDIRTKSGAFEPGGDVSMFGGSYETLFPSFEYGTSTTNMNLFVNGSYNHNQIGLENPTSSYYPIHDTTDQYKGFLYGSYILDDTSRLSVMGSGSYNNFQVPNTPGLPPGTSPGGVEWNTVMSVTNFNSANLDENQNEQNYYGVIAYQKSAGNFNLQLAGFGRCSAVHFTPDPVGDLFYNGVASDVNRTLYSGGLQLDTSDELNEKHTLRGGTMFLGEYLTDNTSTTVFPVDANGDPTGGSFPIDQSAIERAQFFGLYAQDEWKIVPKITLNYGARFDLYWSSFDNENQVSPRVNLIYQPTDNTTLHAGYARYFTPPPLENVPTTDVNAFDGTSNGSSVTNNIGSLKAERAHYFDVGISQKLARGLQVSLDGYYKNAQNQLDDGLFGQTLILQAFNYSYGRVYGLEFTGTYTLGGLGLYANIAASSAQGKNWNSAQFLFDPADLAYVKNNWIYLDHDQTLTGSFGASYLWRHSTRSSTRFYLDALYGSGLRADLTTSSGETIPNGTTVPAYSTVNLGAAQTFLFQHKQSLTARLDIVNVADKVYQLRNGTGIGVNAAQYGMRLGLFGSLTYAF
jgi:outer membrane receptor protein involved in Fe transport